MIVISGVRLSTPTRRETNLEMDFAKTFTTPLAEARPIEAFRSLSPLAAADFISALT